MSKKPTTSKARRPKPMSRYLPADEAFLDPLKEDRDRPEEARCVVIPFGLEASVSYGSGTKAGPRAILEASHQLELFDDELWREPYKDYGIATLPEPKLPRSVPAALDLLEGLVESVLAEDKMPFVIGGEHSLTAGAIRPFARRHSDLFILQLDAHADLRDGYLGEHYSHASAMRRCLDHPSVSLVSVGIRAICEAEAQFIDASRGRVWTHHGHAQATWDIERIITPLAGKHVYVTFDIDGLDGAIMPATGTPTPWGMSYAQAMELIRRTAEVSTIVGMDLVELAPIKGLHAYDFLAAQIAYKMMNYALSGTRRR